MSRVHDIRVGQCGQILQRAPTITKDLLDRMQHAPIKKSVICGYEYKTKQLWLLAGLFLLFFLSTVGTLLMWTTNIFDTFLLSNMVLSNGSLIFEFWSRPPASVDIKVYLFNYTNVDDFEQGLADKLHVQEVGPYVYEESKERVNIQFKDDGTVTYREHFKHKFLPHLSKGKQSDKVVVPNILMMVTAQKTQESFLFTRMAASLTLGGVMNKKPFMKIAAHRFIWGYDDSVYELAKGILTFQNPYLIRDQFGLLTLRNGTVPDVFAVNTGSKGMENYGYISAVNEEARMHRWSTEACDTIDGSDAYLFPPSLVRQKKDVHIYLPTACRKLPLVFKKEKKIINGTVPAYEYVIPEDVFASADVNFANQCYCDINTGICPPGGFADGSQCAGGAPLYISFPHMYNVDPALVKVTGQHPTAERSVNSVSLHPRLGYPMGGNVRMQLNVRAKKSVGFYAMDLFREDEIMLPVSWIDAGIDEKNLPSKILDLIYMTTFTVRGMELTAKYGFLLTSLFTLIVASIIMKNKWLSRRAKLNRTAVCRANPNA